MALILRFFHGIRQIFWPIISQWLLVFCGNMYHCDAVEIVITNISLNDVVVYLLNMALVSSSVSRLY